MKIVRRTVVRKYKHPKRTIAYKDIECGRSNTLIGKFDHMITIRHDPSEMVHDLIMLVARQRSGSGVITKVDHSLKTGLNSIDNLVMQRLQYD
jgi:hypothetical protein